MPAETLQPAPENAADEQRTAERELLPMADALGLTTVHVNRTLQALRSEGLINWRGTELELPNPAGLRRSVVGVATRAVG